MDKFQLERKIGVYMYIARQPIFDLQMNVYGYELLFRADEFSTEFGLSDSIKATASVLGGLFELGANNIVSGKKAFINFDHDFLISGLVEIIPSKTLVIEVLENTIADEDILMAIRYYKKKGYTIALDDFVEDINKYPIVPEADIIKYDIIETPLDTLYDSVKFALKDNKIILAEKIETLEEFIQAKKMGFKLFQGFFFSRPKIIGGIKNANASKTVFSSLISELQKKEPSFIKLAEIVRMDVNLTYRMMKAVGIENKDDLQLTVKNALTKMGLKEMERLVHIMMLQEMGKNKTPELIRMALVRSKFGELIAQNSIYRKRKNEVSLMGLFSVLDVLLDISMEEALKDLPVDQDIKEVLTLGTGNLKDIKEIILAYEDGMWNNLNELGKKIKAEDSKLSKWYFESIVWADEIMKKTEL